MPDQQISQYNSGNALPGPSQYQSRGSQVPTQYASAWGSSVNAASGRPSTQGNWNANSPPRPLSAANPAANSQFKDMGSWYQGNPARANSQDFNQYVDSILNTKTSSNAQRKQQLPQPVAGPLPWDTRWMPDRGQAGGYSKSSTRM
ncbi:unnamed protein product [Cercospora beticola]|nr:unnamed protein product [Cercospora beticola]